MFHTVYIAIWSLFSSILLPEQHPFLHSACNFTSHCILALCRQATNDLLVAAGLNLLQVFLRIGKTSNGYLLSLLLIMLVIFARLRKQRNPQQSRESCIVLKTYEIHKNKGWINLVIVVCISVCIRAPLTCKFNKLKCDITCGDQLPEEGEVSTIWNHCCAYSNSSNSANYSLAEVEYLTYLNVGENFPRYKLTKEIKEGDRTWT